MTSVVPAEVIARAEARANRDSGFAVALAALVDTPASAAGEYERFVASGVNQQRRGDAVDEFKTAALVTSDVQRLLGLGTPQAVHRLRSRGKLVGLQLGNATWFPAWQFLDHRLRPDLPRILELLRLFTTDTIGVDRAMRLVRLELGGHSIAAALDRPRLAHAAWTALAELSG